MRRQHVTLDDIARRLKVSRVTVSKALRGHVDISVEMTRRIRKLADELGYTPNIMARNLSSRRSHMIGLVVPKIAHSFFGSVIEGVYDAAFDRNYETILTVSQENADREYKHLQTLVAMRVDGIIISISQQTRDVERFDWLRKLGMPTVFMDRRPEPGLPGFSSVVVDDRLGGFQAAEQAIRVGYRSIGFVGGDASINIGRDRLRGFEEAMEHYGIPVNRQWIVPGGYGKDDGYNALKILHDRGSIPEFVLTVTYPVALGVYEAARALGIRIPDDLDLICFGDSDVGKFLSPAPSVIRQPTYDLGGRTVEVLLETLSSLESARERHVILPTQLMLRETCAAKRATGREGIPPAVAGIAAV